MNLINEIVNRLMNIMGYSTKKELAKAINISAPDLNNRIKSGTVKQLLIDHAINNNVNIDWLLTGKGEATARHKVAELAPLYENPPSRRVMDNKEIHISEIIQKAVYIMESNTPHKNAIAMAIEACYQSVLTDEKITEQENKIQQLEEKIKLLAG